MNAHQKAFQESRKRSLRCTDWLKQFMKPGQPKPATKNELFQMGLQEMDISRSNFDAAWIHAIEDMGRQDWYTASPRRKSRPNN